MAKHWTTVALMVVTLIATGLPGLSMSRWLGAGISCEPLDIAGGGFFADFMWNLPVLALGEIGHISLRPVFGLGPLPLRVRLLIFDLFTTVEFPLKGFTLFAGAGYGVVYAMEGGLQHSGVLTAVGLTDVLLAETLRMYVQLRTRGTGFFLSPGFGLQFRF